MIGMPNINQYFKVAMSYPVAKLQAVMRGQDQSIPMLAAMAAFEIKGPMEIAAKAEQAKQKQSTVSVRDKLAREGEEEKNGMMPDNLMMAMQQQQQGSLPENTGIGQLPAPNMQTMHAANGGIIAFDDGGEVPGYADAGVVPSMDALFGKTYTPNKKARTATAMGGPETNYPTYTPEMQAAEDAKTAASNEEALKQLIAKTPPGPEKDRLIQQLTYLQKAKLAQPAAPDMAPPLAQSEVDRLVQANKSMQNMPREVIPSVAPTQRRTPSAASTVSATPAAPQGVDTEQRMADVMSRISGTQDAEIKSQYADLEKKTGEGIAALRREREVGRPTGKAFEGLETELKEEKDAVKGKEAKNLQMALINAGLAIAGGSSRYAMENIGKGALVGTKQYMDGLDKLEAAAKERRKMTAMIDEARRAEARGDFKEKNEFETRAFELGVNSRKHSIDAIAKISGENKKGAVEIFNRIEADLNANQRNRESIQGHLQGQKLMAAAYGQRGGGEFNVAWDNATNAMKAAVEANPLLKVEYQKNPQKQQADFNNYLQQALNKSTTTGGATMPGGGNLKFLGFEKQ
jgi:hypothetical protein